MINDTKNFDSAAGADSVLLGSTPSLQDKIRIGRVDIENEWQTVQEHLDDDNIHDAEYYLRRLTSECEKLRIILRGALPKGMEYRNGILCCTKCGAWIDGCGCVAVNKSGKKDPPCTPEKHKSMQHDGYARCWHCDCDLISFPKHI